ncbi:hypothetical protein [Porphyrobacter sp. YT40]|uniref:hypothetical protein n=1 Tax=Porphyrobacter sp. YT40 TaxID=2547601 RepID=UPI001142ADBB|nr:hypothetical protein [Porphyrobacter sp. YT40]QDH33551.1 hypothetical protein E2E27_03870 [Porphyrobacter sp. YT40]
MALSLAFAAAQPVAEPPVDHEIEVIANKLRTWRGNWKLSKGAVTCKTKRSTGDKAIDAIGCDAMVQCIAPIAPQFVALGEQKLPKDEMNQRANALVEEAGIGDCIFSRREAGISSLAAARRSKRT